MTKVCAVCGKPFTPSRSNVKYCSKECKAEANRRRTRERYQSQSEEEKRRKRERYRGALKRWRQAHREERNAYSREYYRKNRDEICRKKREKWAMRKNKLEIKACSEAHDGCFSCPTEDGECLYD